MTTTVNGKSLEQCFQELRQYQKPDEYKMGKYPYYKIQTYFERINKVFGMEHYNITYPDFTDIYKISSNQEFITVKCHLEIIDDNGNIVLIREGFSSREITFNELGREVNLNNLYRSTSQLALKSALAHFNIFGKSYDEDDSYDKPAATGKEKETNKSNQNSCKEDKPIENNNTNDAPYYSIVTTGHFKVERKDTYGKPVYSVMGKCTDKTNCKIIFYPNQYKKYEDKMNSYINLCNKGNVEIRFKASSSGTKDGVLQLIFKGFN